MIALASVTLLWASGIAPVAYNTIAVGGSSQTQRPTLNLIAGSNITLTPADNSGANRTDVTITGAGGAGGAPIISISNDGTTGTTTNTLTKLTGAPSTAIIAAISDTGGAVGVCTATCGTTGTATITLMGSVSLVFDGATTAGDYVQISSTTAGNGHDAGATYPTTGQVVGRVLSTNGGAGTYSIDLYPSEIKGGSGGAAVTLAGLYITSGGNNWGPVYPVTKPAASASWTAAGFTTTLNDISGGGLSFLTDTHSDAAHFGGWSLARAGTTFTFTVMESFLQASNNESGIFCADSAGNASLFDWVPNTHLNVAHWTGMQNGGTPAFSATIANNTNPIPAGSGPIWLRMQDNGTNRISSFSTNGVDFQQFNSETHTTFVNCSTAGGRVGIVGIGDGTFKGLATIVSVANTTP